MGMWMKLCDDRASNNEEVEGEGVGFLPGKTLSGGQKSRSGTNNCSNVTISDVA